MAEGSGGEQRRVNGYVKSENRNKLLRPGVTPRATHACMSGFREQSVASTAATCVLSAHAPQAAPTSSPESPPLIEGNAVRTYTANVEATCTTVTKLAMGITTANHTKARK